MSLLLLIVHSQQITDYDLHWQSQGLYSKGLEILWRKCETINLKAVSRTCNSDRQENVETHIVGMCLSMTTLAERCTTWDA